MKGRSPESGEVRTVRRLMGPILGVALLAAAAGSVSAAPVRTATLTWACLNADGVHLQVDWAGYHPDNAVPVAWQSGSSQVVASSMNRQTDWKFGTAQWDPTYASFPTTFAAGTMVAVDLYGHGKFIAETNAVDWATLTACGS